MRSHSHAGGVAPAGGAAGRGALLGALGLALLLAEAPGRAAAGGCPPPPPCAPPQTCPDGTDAFVETPAPRDDAGCVVGCATWGCGGDETYQGEEGEVVCPEPPMCTTQWVLCGEDEVAVTPTDENGCIIGCRGCVPKDETDEGEEGETECPEPPACPDVVLTCGEGEVAAWPKDDNDCITGCEVCVKADNEECPPPPPCAPPQTCRDGTDAFVETPAPRDDAGCVIGCATWTCDDGGEDDEGEEGQTDCPEPPMCTMEWVLCGEDEVAVTPTDENGCIIGCRGCVDQEEEEENDEEEEEDDEEDEIEVECEPITCPAVVVICGEGEVKVEPTDDNGCVVGCETCVPDKPDGDDDGDEEDGEEDDEEDEIEVECEPITCPAVVVICGEGEVKVEPTDDNGCVVGCETCVPDKPDGDDDVSTATGGVQCSPPSCAPPRRCRGGVEARLVSPAPRDDAGCMTGCATYECEDEDVANDDEDEECPPETMCQLVPCADGSVPEIVGSKPVDGRGCVTGCAPTRCLMDGSGGDSDGATDEEESSDDEVACPFHAADVSCPVVKGPCGAGKILRRPRDNRRCAVGCPRCVAIAAVAAEAEDVSPVSVASAALPVAVGGASCVEVRCPAPPEGCTLVGAPPVRPNGCAAGCAGFFCDELRAQNPKEPIAEAEVRIVAAVSIAISGVAERHVNKAKAAAAIARVLGIARDRVRVLRVEKRAAMVGDEPSRAGLRLRRALLDDSDGLYIDFEVLAGDQQDVGVDSQEAVVIVEVLEESLDDVTTQFVAEGAITGVDVDSFELEIAESSVGAASEKETKGPRWLVPAAGAAGGVVLLAAVALATRRFSAGGAAARTRLHDSVGDEEPFSAAASDAETAILTTLNPMCEYSRA